MRAHLNPNANGGDTGAVCSPDAPARDTVAGVWRAGIWNSRNCQGFALRLVRRTHASCSSGIETLFKMRI